MLDYLKYFFNPRHLFSLRPPLMQNRAVLILLITFGVFIVAGIACNVLTKSNKNYLTAKGFKKLANLFLTTGSLGLVYLFFAWQGVTLLSARFWLLILLIVAAVWLIFILKYLMIQVPKKRQEINKKREFEKYIP